MIEKITLNEALSSLQEATSVGHLVGMSGNDGKLIDPDNLPYPDNGCGISYRNKGNGIELRLEVQVMHLLLEFLTSLQDTITVPVNK